MNGFMQITRMSACCSEMCCTGASAGSELETREVRRVTTGLIQIKCHALAAF